MAPRRSKSSDLAAAPPAATDEPTADWKPLWCAPFYCFAEGYICSVEAWKDAVYAEVQRITSSYHIGAPNKSYPELIGLAPPEWVLERSTKDHSAWISALGITMDIMPGCIFIFYSGRLDDATLGGWLIGGSSDDILQDQDWDEVAPDKKMGAQWHRWLLEGLFLAWKRNFVAAVESGSVFIMARKNSVFALFERITWEQWQFFTLDDDEERTLPIKKQAWHDPGLPTYVPKSKKCSAATGPAGERTFSIHVAPTAANRLIRPIDPEEKCLQWVLELMRDFPDRPPVPLPRLAEEASSKFGVTKRGFERCYFAARVKTDNRNWSRPGAPAKFPHESQQKK